MTSKRALIRAAAEDDVQAAIDFYLDEGPPAAALNFIDALKKALERIEQHPGIGSTRCAHELDLPGLRAWPLKGYPHIVFYVEARDCVDVWRVLHGGRDIPSWLHAEG